MMISRNQYPNFTLRIASVLSLLLLISPLSLFSQDSSPPSPDFNGDGIVDLLDYDLFVGQWNTRAGDENWDAKFDLHGDGVINLLDYGIFVSNWNKTFPVNNGESSPQQEVTPQVTISAGTTPVTEGTSATFTITANPAPTSLLTVNVDVSEDGDVISGTPSSTVIINANNTTATLTINTDNDQADESNSVVTAEVESGTGYRVGSSSSASVTVNDNDDPEVTISAGTTPVTEGTAATFTITASSAPTSALTVTVTVTEDGDVISRTPSSTVTIDADETTATLTVATDDDDVDESNSVVTAEVESGTGYRVGSSSSASVTIDDNDNPAPPPQQPVTPPVVINDNDPPEVTISAGTTPVTEGTSATFTITASSAPTSDLTVNVDVSEDGDVISGTPSSTVIINANNTAATLTINTVNDQTDESNSVITAEVESGTGYTVGSSSSASVTVNDNDPPQVTISAGTTPVTEGTSATFTIIASSAPTSPLTVNVDVSEDGDVISGAPSLTVTIDANTTTATLTVDTVNDQADEGASKITAEVESGTGYTVGSSSSASVTVNDNDDPEITISAGTSPVTEGTSATFTITASSAPTSPLIVNVDVNEDGDVISGTPSSTVIINANNTTATLTINTVNDQTDESNSVITAEVETGIGYTVGSTSSASVTVNDNDPPEVTISADTTPVTEGTSATFTITASSAPTSALTVNVNVSEDGDVISGTAPSTVTIKANATTTTLTVATVNDEADESNSVVTAELETGTGYTVGSSSSASVTVRDNDEPTPQVTISAGSAVTEGTSATFTITASPAPTSDLTVNVDVSEDGDVISGTPPSTVTIKANAIKATLTVNTVNDEVDESNSVITAEVQSGTGYTVDSSSSASVTVNDNDDPAPLPQQRGAPEVTILAGTKSVTEGTSATFRITASSAPTTAITVSVSVTEDGDVISGTPSSSVTINANETTATLTVATDDDEVIESNGRVTAEVQTGTGYTVGSPSTASVVVQNNDRPAPVASIEIDPSSIEFTSVDSSVTLTVRVLDKDGNETRATSWGWESADESVATVYGYFSSGSVTVSAAGVGKTTITISAGGGGGEATGTVTVTVTVSGPRVAISPTSLTFEAAGDTQTVTVKVLDENGDEDADASFGWFGFFSPGSEIDIETVEGGLEVTSGGGGRGTVEIFSEGAAKATLIITAYQKPASLELSPSSANLTVGGGTATLSATVKDANGHEIGVDQGDGEGGRVVYWETSDSAVATVDGVTKNAERNTGGTATVTAVTAGTVTITGWVWSGGRVAGTATIKVTE